MQKIILAWPNRSEGATLSGGSWSISSPLSNLKTRFSYEVSRSTDTTLASTQFDAALDSVRSISFVALLRHNLTTAAFYRLRASDTAGDFTAPLYDSGWSEVWPSMVSFGDTDWGDEGWWGGKLSSEAIDGYPTILLSVLGMSVRAQYWRLELKDESNAAGYVEASRLWMSGQWQPSRNMRYGASLGWEDSSPVQTALDNTEYYDERVKTRILHAEFNGMGHDEAYSRYLEMTRQLGTTKEMLVVPDADDISQLIRRSFVGRLRQLSPVEAYTYRLYKGSIEIKETV